MSGAKRLEGIPILDITEYRFCSKNKMNLNPH